MIEYTVKVFDKKTEWWLNEKLHRENDLPAVEQINGTKIWYINGLHHRVNGPAVESADGDKYWWLEGVRYSEEEYNQRINPKQEIYKNQSIIIDGKKYKLIEAE